jgi:hypothetical protein
MAWAVGLPVIKAIGYDASPADMKRSTNPGDEKERFWYPLRDAGLTRPQLIEIIERAGLPQPGKSACFMCPASKPAEVLHLLNAEPEKLALALKIEAGALLKTARTGRAATTVGLGRTWSWRQYLESNAPERLAALDRAFDCGLAEWLVYLPLRDALLAGAAPTHPVPERDTMKNENPTLHPSHGPADVRRMLSEARTDAPLTDLQNAVKQRIDDLNASMTGLRGRQLGAATKSVAAWSSALDEVDRAIAAQQRPLGPEWIAQHNDRVRANSLLTLACNRLREAGPATCKDLLAYALQVGWTTTGKTPESTLNAALHRELKKPGARVKKSDRGVWEAA